MKCGESSKEKQELEPGTSRQFAVVVLLEGGPTHFCQDSGA